MKLFAIELSSRFGSLALVDNGEIVAEKRWEESFKNRQQLFDAMAEMQVDWDCVDGFAVGRGPGAFSGMRIGFSVVNALAAAGDKPVHALNSGAALAAKGGAPETVVVGDARRSKVWAGRFTGSELEDDFQLMEYDQLSGFIPRDALVVSPDADRLEELLAGFRQPEKGVPRFPSAGILGQLAGERIGNDIASEPFEPLYMHPPVFIEPRFPA